MASAAWHDTGRQEQLPTWSPSEQLPWEGASLGNGADARRPVKNSKIPHVPCPTNQATAWGDGGSAPLTSSDFGDSFPRLYSCRLMAELIANFTFLWPTVTHSPFLQEDVPVAKPIGICPFIFGDSGVMPVTSSFRGYSSTTLLSS